MDPSPPTHLGTIFRSHRKITVAARVRSVDAIALHVFEVTARCNRSRGMKSADGLAGERTEQIAATDTALMCVSHIRAENSNTTHSHHIG